MQGKQRTSAGQGLRTGERRNCIWNIKLINENKEKYLWDLTYFPSFICSEYFGGKNLVFLLSKNPAF